MQVAAHTTKLTTVSSTVQAIVESLGLTYFVKLQCPSCLVEVSESIIVEFEQKELLLKRLEALRQGLYLLCKCSTKSDAMLCKVEVDGVLSRLGCIGIIRTSLNSLLLRIGLLR